MPKIGNGNGNVQKTKDQLYLYGGTNFNLDLKNLVEYTIGVHSFPNMIFCL